jgi:hypothetical protein
MRWQGKTMARAHPQRPGGAVPNQVKGKCNPNPRQMTFAV